MEIVKNRTALKECLESEPFRGRSRALVPTMGALHDGHLSLIEEARSRAETVVATIFVNPKQFGPNEDFSRYPRDEVRDLARLREAGADLAYVPDPRDMYPDGFQTKVSLGPIAEPLDGRSRPGFFDGIATVVTKLLTRTRPDIAVFGEKDYQQLLVIRQLSDDLDLGTKIVGAPIIREEDGLAMSSRNRYLSPPERRIAGELNQIMRKVCERIEGGVPVSTALLQGMGEMESVGLRPIDYFELRSGTDLQPMPERVLRQSEMRDARLFAAVMLGGTRLIDNMPVIQR
jgi:pantoate--beta-alanine ligase